MAASVMASSLRLKPAPFTVEKSAARGLPSLAKTPFKIVASGGKKIKTDKPFGIGGGMELRDCVDASGRRPKGKGVYQFVDKYGANVDGYRSLQSNYLSGFIPSELGNLSNLLNLDLSGNSLSGSIPPSLGKLQNLITFRVLVEDLVFS